MAGVTAARAEEWVDMLNAACSRYEITRSARRMAAFLGHIAQETGGLKRVEENLNWSEKLLPKLMRTYSALESVEEATTYLHNPVALANKVYGDKHGNTDSGDGWKYRGRGLIQVTFKNNYIAAKKELNVDVVSNPDLLATPKYASLSAAHFLKSHGLNELADKEMYRQLSKRINTTLNPEREAKRMRALDVLCRATLANMTISLVNGWFGGFH